MKYMLKLVGYRTYRVVGVPQRFVRGKWVTVDQETYRLLYRRRFFESKILKGPKTLHKEAPPSPPKPKEKTPPEFSPNMSKRELFELVLGLGYHLEYKEVTKNQLLDILNGEANDV